MNLITEKNTPIRFVKSYGDIYPNVYNMLDSTTEKLHAEYPDKFPNWCYMPTSVAAQLMNDTGGYEKEYSDICAGLVTCAMWRKHKIIYQLHPDLVELLCNQAEDISDMDSIPVKIILENMPYPVIYVMCNNIWDKCNGFFAWVDLIDWRPVLRFGFTPLSEDVIAFSSLMLVESGTILDCLSATAANSKGNPARTAEEIRPFLKALQILLYILSANSDQVENDRSKSIHRKSQQIKDKFREVKQIDVGVHVSAAMRQATTGSAVSTGTGSPKRSHMRRGHWHHYWIGKANQNRRIVLKWLAPMAIKCQGLKEIPVTITPVNKL